MPRNPRVYSPARGRLINFLPGRRETANAPREACARARADERGLIRLGNEEILYKRAGQRAKRGRLARKIDQLRRNAAQCN